MDIASPFKVLRKTYSKMVWRAVCFVLFFLDLVLSPFGTFKILDAIFEQKLSTNFTQKELR